MPSYSLETLQALALYTQGLTSRHEPTIQNIDRMVEQVGAVQIDTLQMVQRSQYLTLWSRFGTYNTAEFDRLMYDHEHRRLFEYWWHEACIVPLSEYRYRLPKMNFYKNGGSKWNADFLAHEETPALMEKILASIQENGGVRSADFDHNGQRGSSWWGWKPAKRALEHLYNTGDLMISRRKGFQRVYDLRERVLPEWVDTTAPSEDETNRHLLDISLKAQGVCQPMQTADYTYMKRSIARPHIQALIDDGTFVEIQGVLQDGKQQTLVVHRDNLDALQQIADGEIRAEHTTFLSPFDSLWWAKDRDQQFWNFRQVLEAYKPAPIREWGYFCLPILHKNRLVGRFDPKLERKKGELVLRALYLEPGIEPEDELVAGVAEAMRDFLNFHHAKALVLEASSPKEFGQKLEKKL